MEHSYPYGIRRASCTLWQRFPSPAKQELRNRCLSDLIILIKYANESREQRNKIVHGLWSATGTFKVRSTTKKGLTYDFKGHEELALTDTIKRIDQVDTGFSALLCNGF